MSPAFAVTLVVVPVVLGVLRLILPGLPLPGAAVRLRATDLVLIGVGVLGLVLHCAAMFFPSLVGFMPDPVTEAINRLGVGSVAWYVGPALLVLVGLRRLPIAALALVLLALVAVGVTMYNGGPVDVHLAAILAAVVALSGSVAVAARLPSRPAPTPT